MTLFYCYLEKETTFLSESAYKEMKAVNKKLNLIEECINGNRTAHKQLYEMYKVKMFTLCMRYMSNRHDAEDMLQEGWIKVFKQLHSFNSEKGSFYGWIRKVFVNTNLEYLRKKRLNFTELSEQDSKMNFSYEEDIFGVMTIKEIVELLQSLPNGYRSVFNLYVIEGYTHKEIGQILKISSNTSKTQLMKARQMMQSKVNMLAVTK